MWYVEAFVGDGFERWEGLTKEQSEFVYKRYTSSGIEIARLGILKT